MWGELASAVTEVFRFLTAWSSPEAERARQEVRLNRQIQELLHVRNTLVAIPTPTDEDRLRLAAVLLELERLQSARTDLLA